MARDADHRLQALERRLRATRGAKANRVLSKMSTDDLGALHSLLVNQEQRPDYLPTDAEQAALGRWQELSKGQ